MSIKFANNVFGFLGEPVDSQDTTFILTSGGGNLFPPLSGAEFYFLTIEDVGGGTEIVRCIGKNNDVLTVERGAENTIPRSFSLFSKIELRITAGAIEAARGERVSLKESRPGDGPEFFNLSGGNITAGLNGTIYRIGGPGIVQTRYYVPLETSQEYVFRLGYQRFKDSGDPANDGITAGVEWYNGFSNKIGETVIHTDDTLLVNSLRRSPSYSVGFAGGAEYDVYIPSSARYGVAWFRTFGVGHETDLDTLLFRESKVLSPTGVSADKVTIPPDFQWPAGTIPSGAGVTDPYDVARTFYVTMDGSDANSGTSLSAPMATIGAALAAAEAVGSPCAVIVHPGEYVVQPDTVIPANCALYGYDLRVTKARLPNGLEQNNMFLMDNGIKVRGLTFVGLQHEEPDDYADVNTGLAAVDDWGYFTVGSTLYRKVAGAAVEPEHDYPPEKGWAFVFKPGAFITRSPYIADCSQLHDFTQDEMTLPIDREAGNPLMPRGGGNLRADGSVLAPSSPLRSVVVDSYTAINPNGYGYLMTRNAFVQLVSVFTNWSRYGLWCHDGGQVTVANSNNTFGDFALVATGFRNSVRIDDPVGAPRGVFVPLANAIIQDRDVIVDEMYAQLADEFVEVQNFTEAQEEFTRRDARTLLKQLSDDFRSGQDRGSQYFVKGLFDWNGEYHFDAALLPIFLRSFDIIEERILARCQLSQSAEDMLASLIQLIKDNLSSPQTVPFMSVIEATGQQFSYVGSGVNLNSLPFSQRGTGLAGNPELVNLKLDGGRIFATFSTEVGDTYLGDDLRVDFERGVVEGQAFSRGVQNITLPLIQALGG